MIKGIIYKYTSPDGKVYIGQTINEINRKFQHRSACWKKDTHFYRAIRKYGIESFTYEIVFKCSSKNTKRLQFILDLMEIYFIKKYDSYNNGYNSTKGGTNRADSKKSGNIIHIGQYNSKMELVKIWNSAIEVERILGIPSLKITQSCKNLRGMVDDFKWKFIKS